MTKKTLLLLSALALFAWPAAAQTNFPATGGGTGSADPSQFSSSAGTLTIGGSVGAVTIDADTTVIPLYSTGTSDPATACTVGGMFHYRTDSSLLKLCTAVTPTWTAVVTDNRLTDCQDTGGNHLNYNSSTGAWSCGTSSASTAFDASTTMELYEEFITGDTVSARIGTHGVAVTAIATGTSSTLVTASAEHPGLLRLNSHATNDNSGEAVGFYGQTTGSTPYDVWLTHDSSIDAVVLFGSNSTAITNTALYVGLMPTFTDPATQTAGIWIRHDSDRSDTTFVFAVCNSSTSGCGSAGDDTAQKVVASTITPSAGTYYRFRIRRAASGVGGNPTIYMRVNNETEKTFCSSGCDDTLATIPATGNLAFFVTYLTRTTTGVLSADVDYMYMRVPGLSRY